MLEASTMHVLYLIDSLVEGGAERSLVGLARRYAERGVKLDVAYLHDRAGLQGELTRANANLYCLAGSGGRLGWIGRLTKLIRRLNPDVVHTTLFEADQAGRISSRLTHVPVVSSLVNIEYGLDQLSDPGLKRWKVRTAQLLDVITARNVRRFHAVSRHVADAMAARLKIPRDHIDVVPRGRDPVELGIRTHERRAAAREKIGVDPNAALVLAAARHEYQKGLDILVDAIPAILRTAPGARLVIAGRDGGQTEQLRTTIAKSNLEHAVLFVGARSDIPELMCAADVFAFPSRWEGLPGAILEAMALEAPIVASDIPPVREVVGDSHAILVPPSRADALAVAILESLSTPSEATARAQRARLRFLDRFTLDEVADGMIRFYDRALEVV
jgi:glycosyltransferase involved in cell wall biosynthesis